MPEYKILNLILENMEATGSTHNVVRVNIDQKMVEEVNLKNGTNFLLTVLQKATDKCLAHEWLEHTSIGSGNYFHLKITPKGIGVARSKTAVDEKKASRSKLKKVSDYIEEHKGIFALLGLIIALSTFAAKFLGKS